MIASNDIDDFYQRQLETGEIQLNFSTQWWDLIGLSSCGSQNSLIRILVLHLFLKITISMIALAHIYTLIN